MVFRRVILAGDVLSDAATPTKMPPRPTQHGILLPGPPVEMPLSMRIIALVRTKRL